MKVNSAEFIVGAASPGQFPSPFLPEVAFAGKSNVGKSSLINTLLNRKHLVKTSGTPGKTRQINFFLINGEFRLVDLPGYGFSRAPKSEQERWEPLIETYFRDNPALRGVVMIVDTRHPPGPLDQGMIEWLEAFRLPYLVVANKVDKLKKNQLSSQLDIIRATLSLKEPPLPFSAKSRMGRNQLSSRIVQWLAPGKSGTEGSR